MCYAPDELTDGLRVARDSNDAGLPQVELWFIYSSHFQDVEGRRVEEVEGNERSCPNGLVDKRLAPAEANTMYNSLHWRKAMPLSCRE